MIDNTNLNEGPVVFILDNGRRIKASKNILSARCEYFRVMFSSSMRESTEEEVHVSDMSEQALRILLNYLYTDRVS